MPFCGEGGEEGRGGRDESNLQREKKDQEKEGERNK